MVVELLAKEKNEKLQYQGKCKLIIDSISKLLLVEPINEEFKLISAMFKWKFIAKKKILFIFGEFDFQDFALIFDNTNICNKVYNFLINKGANCIVKGDLIRRRFFPSLITEILKKDTTTTTHKLKEIFAKWIKSIDKKEKYTQILKDYNIFDLIYPKKKQKSVDENNYCSGNVDNSKYRSSRFDNAHDSSKRLLRKRRRRKCCKKKMVETSIFEIFNYIKNGQEKKVIFVFPTADKKVCYKYCWREYKNSFGCIGCGGKKKHLSAQLVKRNGKNIFLVQENEHFCDPIKLHGFIEIPNFETFTCNRKKMLIIFADASRTSCYVYSWVFNNIDVENVIL